MTLVVIIVLAAVVVVYAVRDRLGRSLANLLLGVLLVVGLALMVLTLTGKLGGGGRIPEVLHASPGYMLGQKIAETFPDGGTVISFDFAPGNNDVATRVYKARVDGLQRALGSGSFTVVEEGPEQAEGLLAEFSEEGLSAALLLEAAGKHPDAVAMVSFVGLPNARDRGSLKGIPPIYAFALGDPRMTRSYLQQGIVPAVVSYRPDADWGREPTSKDSLEDVCAEFYILVTKENLNALGI